MINIKPGDLVTLKGINKVVEKPVGIVKRIWPRSGLEIFWLNEKIAKRYAVKTYVDPKKLEVISEARPE
tara:strand:- start:3901 stop:4107 length:207 start_codon:yes stop_codon:yes gene_type:complete